ncbi:MAG: hypothetical protein NTV55_00765 [Planctomycetota bacterium]|nr:hypothetical protein [Planctomycetota bacterium]
MADDSTGGADDSTEGAEKPAHVELAFQVAVSTIGQLEATWLWALKALEAIVPVAGTTFPVLALQLATNIQTAQAELKVLTDALPALQLAATNEANMAASNPATAAPVALTCRNALQLNITDTATATIKLADAITAAKTAAATNIAYLQGIQLLPK